MNEETKLHSLSKDEFRELIAGGVVKLMLADIEITARDLSLREIGDIYYEIDQAESDAFWENWRKSWDEMSEEQYLKICSVVAKRAREQARLHPNGASVSVLLDIVDSAVKEVYNDEG